MFLFFFPKLIDKYLEGKSSRCHHQVSGESKKFELTLLSLQLLAEMCHCQVINIFLAFEGFKEWSVWRIMWRQHCQSYRSASISNELGLIYRRMRKIGAHFVGVIVWNNCLRTWKKCEEREREKVKEEKSVRMSLITLMWFAVLNKFKFFIEFYNFWLNYEFTLATQYMAIKFKAPPFLAKCQIFIRMMTWKEM